tara:strand:+ start:13240 stop:14088 length:849 start_codon:yes stop_codon:yes gene_type:complete
MIEARELERLLMMTKRECNVMGKPKAQVIACILTPEEGTPKRVRTTSLVRDGKTSVASFSVRGEIDSPIVIPDIDRVLGVLKGYRGQISIENLDGKIRFKGVNGTKKQTTLTANLKGLAFPHSKETIGEWHDKSCERAKVIDYKKGYTLKDGSLREFMAVLKVSKKSLHHALECDNINGQKLNRYTFAFDGEGLLIITTGKELKGETQTEIKVEYVGETPPPAFSATYEGGLENILKYCDKSDKLRPNMWLNFLDFRPENQGIPLVMGIGLSDFVYQAPVVS